MTDRLHPLTALNVVLDELEDSIDHGHPAVYVGVERAIKRLRSDCDNPDVRHLSYAPHHVSVEADDLELIGTGHNELLDAPWDDTGSYWCKTCDAELDGELVALAHLRGFDLTWDEENGDG